MPKIWPTPTSLSVGAAAARARWPPPPPPPPPFTLVLVVALPSLLAPVGAGGDRAGVVVVGVAVVVGARRVLREELPQRLERRRRRPIAGRRAAVQQHARSRSFVAEPLAELRESAPGRRGEEGGIQLLALGGTARPPARVVGRPSPRDEQQPLGTCRSRTGSFHRARRAVARVGLLHDERWRRRSGRRRWCWGGGRRRRRWPRGRSTSRCTRPPPGG